MLADVEQAATGQPMLGQYISQLDELLSVKHMEVDGHLTNKFAQALGEAHFAVLCDENGVTLNRIPEVKGVKTPDFESAAAPGKLFFEVKTLSVVGGEDSIDEHVRDSVDVNLELEQKVRAGDRVAMVEGEITPYGHKVGFDTQILDVTNILIEKARQNIKPGQFAAGSTFLVLNLSMLPLPDGETGLLRPSYPDDRLFPTCVTGALWTMAFGKPGMLIQSEPEFEGKGCVEGELAKCGILSDEEYEYVKGILFVVHPMRGRPRVWALFRDFEEMTDNHPEVLEDVLKVAGTNWNDRTDMNGWQLGRRGEEQ
ncbi:hypothetical protein PPH94_005345 [Burkholderia cepacia]|uniref:hypothetical protein n=1 Tax=Burkholderia cepacia TaxID=292 RepID=UPI0023492890|nr:hypothetical protein [Burkholderia cepacia]MDC6098990.1 hypothetical protein [Burkholderia cepacia]